MGLQAAFKAARVPARRFDKRFRNDRLKPRYRRRFRPRYPRPKMKLR